MDPRFKNPTHWKREAYAVWKSQFGEAKKVETTGSKRKRTGTNDSPRPNKKARDSEPSEEDKSLSKKPTKPTMSPSDQARADRTAFEDISIDELGNDTYRRIGKAIAAKGSFVIPPPIALLEQLRALSKTTAGAHKPINPFHHPDWQAWATNHAMPKTATEPATKPTAKPAAKGRGRDRADEGAASHNANHTRTPQIRVAACTCTDGQAKEGAGQGGRRDRADVGAVIERMKARRAAGPGSA